MPCSYCGRGGHDIRTCPSITTKSPETFILGPSNWVELFKNWATRHVHNQDVLIHCYFPRNLVYFNENMANFKRGECWELYATRGHGIGNPQRPTINFFLLDEKFVSAFQKSREDGTLVDFSRFVVVKQSYLASVTNASGYEIAHVQVRYPIDDAKSDYWKYDHWKYRPRLGNFSHCQVIRLAVPIKAPPVTLPKGKFLIVDGIG